MPRKNAATEPPASPSTPSPSKLSTTSKPTTSNAMQTPYLPTSTEQLILSIYPITLILGSAFSHLSPLTRAPWTLSTYSHIHQSFQPPEAAPSYFATKRNIFNVYFVKIGWFWCTIAFLVFIFLGSRASRIRFGNFSSTDQSNSSREDSLRRSKRVSERLIQTAAETARLEGDTRLRRRYQALLRYAICTLFWILVTQWCFGAPLVDRGFSFTGGQCEISTTSPIHSTETVRVFTHAACKKAGGRWKGGYDVSGHVFLLVLGSGMLWAEMMPVNFSEWWGVAGGRVVSYFDAATGLVIPKNVAETDPVPHTMADVHPHSHSPMTTLQQVRSYALTLALGVAVLSWWMLLMTSAFFHTWSEKTFALLLSAGALWTVYVLPRASPIYRSVVGMPGV